MNKKGFTLVELLAVIVILSLLALITSTAVTKLVKDSKEQLSKTQEQLIKSAAETWGADNLLKLPKSDECSYLTLENLQKYGLLDSKIIDPSTNTEIDKNLKIKIITTTSDYGNPVTTYEVDPKEEDLVGCKKIYEICTPVTGDDLNYKYVYNEDGEYLLGEATYTTGTKRVGDAYRCEVNAQDSYIFNIIGQDALGNYNLLLNHNIGQVNGTSINTIFESLTNKTDSWINIEERTDSYTGEYENSELTKVTYTFNYSGHFARFINYSELQKFASAGEWNENSMPWISSILKNRQTVSEVDWTYMSSSINKVGNSKNVTAFGLGCGVGTCDYDVLGIRPVITVSEGQIK